MGIIDFRMRPLYGGYQAMEKNGTVDRFLSGLNCEKTASMKEKSLKLLVKEMDEAGVELAVVPGRQSKGTFISNEELFEIGRAYPGRFEIFPLYTPENPEESLKEIRTYIDTEGIKGVSIEPGFGNSLLFDDEAYEPLYQLLEEQEMNPHGDLQRLDYAGAGSVPSWQVPENRKKPSRHEGRGRPRRLALGTGDGMRRVFCGEHLSGAGSLQRELPRLAGLERRGRRPRPG